MKHTPLYHEHIKLKGKMIEFASWELPVYYSSIVEEHLAVRSKAGLFDVSHLGRLEITGEDAQALIQYAITNDITKLTDWNIQYSLVCNEKGGILDDILVYKYPDHYLMIVNAANTDTILAVLKENSINRKVTVKNVTEQTGMIAVQGPKALEIINTLYSSNYGHMTKYSFTTFGNVILSRTGYTGEDGFEIIVPDAEAPKVWNQLLDIGISFGLIPAGLGARDTLRLEAGNCLYGHEMDVSTNPYEAGLGFVVKLDKDNFIGKETLAKIKQSPLSRKLIGLEMCNNSIPRNDYAIQKSGKVIGKVTSGTFSPCLKKGIAMGYVPLDSTKLGTELDIVIRDKPYSAKVVQKKWR